jgi:hypothetical protein
MSDVRLPLRPSPVEREAHLRAVAVRLRHRREQARLQVGLNIGRASEADLTLLTAMIGHDLTARILTGGTPSAASEIARMLVAERARRDWLDRDAEATP